MKKLDLSGMTFGRLTVISEGGRKYGKVIWKCVCSCGATTEVPSGALRSGNTSSCGCLKPESTGNRSRTHGMSRSRVYNIWCGMIGRCENESEPAYEKYGGRGISVCPEWRNSFETFLSDMGNPPKHLTIDRIDNDLGYSKDNCRWATYAEQAKNNRRTRLITLNGETLCISDWAKKLGVSEATIRCRIDRFNWSTADAVTRPAA